MFCSIACATAALPSEVTHDFEQQASRLRKAAEIRALIAKIGAEQTANCPGVGKIIIGGKLKRSRAIQGIGVDEAGQFQLGDESVDPVGAQKNRVLSDRLLLIARIRADEPQFARTR